MVGRAQQLVGTELHPPVSTVDAMVQRLAWVTTATARGRDDDEPLALASLAAAGVQVDVVDWDDVRLDWAAYDRVAPRSTWDYPERLDGFLAWLDTVESAGRLCNPAASVRWNLDKRYLVELAADGVPTVPTAVAAAGRTEALPSDAFVIKPAVGAGSRDVGVYGPDQHEAAREHLVRLRARGMTALFQPLLASVAAEGERALVFLDGAFSHAATKHVALATGGEVDDLFAPEVISDCHPDGTELGVARAAMAAVGKRFGPTAYARVDLVRDRHARPCVLELELIEPSLFLHLDPDAPDRLAAALTR